MDFNKMSPREKMMMAATGAVLIFFVYWILLLDPVLRSVEKNRNNIIKLSDKIVQYTKVVQSNLAMPATMKDLNVYPREDQLSYIVSFLYSNLKANVIKLESLRQDSADKKLMLTLSVTGDYENLLNFLNSLSGFKSYFVIDTCSISHSGSKVTAELRVSTPFK